MQLGGVSAIMKSCFCLPARRMQIPDGRHRKLGMPFLSVRPQPARRTNTIVTTTEWVGLRTIESNRAAGDKREHRRGKASGSPDITSTTSIRGTVRPPHQHIVFSSSLPTLDIQPTALTSLAIPLLALLKTLIFRNHPRTPNLHQDAVLYPHYLGPCRHRHRRSY